MITLSDTGAYLIGGNEIIYDTPDGRARYEAELGHKPDQKAASQQTMAYGSFRNTIIQIPRRNSASGSIS